MFIPRAQMENIEKVGLLDLINRIICILNVINNRETSSTHNSNTIYTIGIFDSAWVLRGSWNFKLGKNPTGQI